MRFPPLLSSSTSPDARPKVLIADDHPQVLDSMAAMLADGFEVVGRATDGERALETTHRVDPDLIVLDVAMPGIDGFNVCRALERNGSRARVVFLSMHDADEYVSEAFGSGGRGYVFKTRAAQDLPGALKHVVAGRVFVPSLTSLFRIAEGGSGHAMQIHGDEEAFLDGVASFFDLSLERGDATCLIATPALREGLARRLSVRGWVGNPRYLVIDAADALSRFMRDGAPDPSRLAEIAAELDQFRLATAEGSSPRLTIFGNMVVSLTTNGNAKGALALERMWNMLTHGLPFFTLCSYSTACFHGAGRQDLFAGACAEHWAVSHAGGL